MDDETVDLESIGLGYAYYSTLLPTQNATNATNATHSPTPDSVTNTQTSYVELIVAGSFLLSALSFGVLVYYSSTLHKRQRQQRQQQADLDTIQQ